MHTVVLGAGLAGLAAAYEIAKGGGRVTLIEREPVVGGMARSWTHGPYTLDYGPHRFHSRDEGLIAHLFEVLDNEVVTRERLSRIYMQGKFFHYPLQTQNLLLNMPKRILFKAGWDYVWIRFLQMFKDIPDDNFENWTVKRFGRTLYEIFFGTYTSKAWKMPCSEISADWASQRISQANLWDTVKKTLRPPKSGEVRSLVSEFWYPAHGGIGTIARKYGEKLEQMGVEIHLGTPVRKLEIEDNRVKRVIAGREDREIVIEPDCVVNTIPLPRMVESLDPPISDEARNAIASLQYSSIVFVYLEVDQASVSPDHWVYLPEKELTIHRISEFKNFSDDAAPGDKTIVCCEITCRMGDESWNLDLEGGAKIAIRDLEHVGLIEPGTARGIALEKLRYAYPIYDLTYKDHLNTLKRVARGVANLHTTGRQGLYRYNNMDHSIAMGRRMAKTVLMGEDQRAEEVGAGEEYYG